MRNANSQIMKTRLLIAGLLGRAARYSEAADLFEEVGVESANNALLKYSAPDHLFRCILCCMQADDGLSRASTKLSDFERGFPAFSTSRPYKLCEKLLDAWANVNIEQFQMELSKYDKITKLDEWTVSVLLNVLGRMKASPASAQQADSGVGARGGAEDDVASSDDEDML